VVVVAEAEDTAAALAEAASAEVTWAVSAEAASAEVTRAASAEVTSAELAWRALAEVTMAMEGIVASTITAIAAHITHTIRTPAPTEW
jgi:hypothetical protein